MITITCAYQHWHHVSAHNHCYNPSVCSTTLASSVGSFCSAIALGCYLYVQNMEKIKGTRLLISFTHDHNYLSAQPHAALLVLL